MRNRVLNFNDSRLLPNLFIGGIGGTINTPLLMASKLYELEESDVKNFKVDINNNVSFYLKEPFFFEADSFYGNTDITYVVDVENKMKLLNSQVLRSATNFKTLVSENTYIGGSAMRNTRNKYISVDSTGNFSSHSMRDNTAIKWVRLPNELGRSTFSASQLANLSSCERIYIPSCIQWYDAGSGSNAMFANLNNGCKIYVKPSELTVEGGNPAIPLGYAETLWGAILVGVDNFTSPNSVLDLSANNITANSCDLNFTIPNSSNTLDFYEVWIERQDLGYWESERVEERYNINQEILTTGDTITGLISNTTYKIKVVACDVYWNRSEYSNEIEITTL